MIRRLYAEVFDIILFLVLVYLITIGYISNDYKWSGDRSFKLLLISGSVISIIWGYFLALPHMWNGKTLGMKLFNVGIVYKSGYSLTKVLSRNFIVNYVLVITTFGLFLVVTYLYKFIKKTPDLYQDRFTKTYVYNIDDYEIKNEKDSEKIQWKKPRKIKKKKKK